MQFVNFELSGNPNNNRSVYKRQKKDERHRDELITRIWICNV